MTAGQGFLPSAHGFHFGTRFAGVDVPLVRKLGWTLHDRGVGLCGGMTFAALDLFARGATPPQLTAPPRDGPWFDYLLRRQWDSTLVPATLLKFLAGMNPAWARAGREWSRVRAELDAGSLCTLGLVRVTSWNVADLGENHIVLAYGYAIADATVDLRVYDPAHPDDDHVVLRFEPGARRGSLQYLSPTRERVVGFFRLPYAAPSPAVWNAIRPEAFHRGQRGKARSL